MRRLAPVVVILLSTLLLGAIRSPEYKDRLDSFKRATRPPGKGEPVPVTQTLYAVRGLADLRDERVFKELCRSLPSLGKQVAAASEELTEASFKLEQVRTPYFEEIEEYYRRNGKWPETILETRKRALETLDRIQREKAAAYDGRIRLLEAVQRALGENLLALGEDRARIWKSAVKQAGKSKDPATRATFCAALAEIPGPEAEKLLLDFDESDDSPLVVARALTSLAARGSAKGFERLEARLDHGSWDVEVVAVRGLRRYRRPDTIPALITRLKTAEGRIFADLLEALFGLTGKHLHDTFDAWNNWWMANGEAFLARWSEDPETRSAAIEEITLEDPKAIDIPAELAALLPTEPSAEIRQEIVDVLSIHRSHHARVTLLRTLWDPEKELRLSAIRGLAHYRHLSVPQALMRRVEFADEEELTAIFQALRRLWGGKSEFTVAKPDREALRRWWKLNQGRVGRHFIRLGARDVAAGKPPADVEGKWKDRNFYGLRVLSKRVLFVVDVSLSMEEPAKEGGKRKKIEVAKSELTRVIRALPDDASIGLIGFAATATGMGEGMMQVTSANRKRALEWVEAITTRAATNIYDTLELAFSVGMPGSDFPSSIRPDTIFFVSDGAPTAGKFLDGPTILEHLRRWNERRHLKIHAIGVGHDHDVDFLRKLAEQSGGHYVAR